MQQYYVHYCNYDKRLDEWIGEERFLSEKEIEEYMKNEAEDFKSEISQANSSSLSGTLTRTMRRKFEDCKKQCKAKNPPGKLIYKRTIWKFTNLTVKSINYIVRICA